MKYKQRIGDKKMDSYRNFDRKKKADLIDIIKQRDNTIKNLQNQINELWAENDKKTAETVSLTQKVIEICDLILGDKDRHDIELEAVAIKDRIKLNQKFKPIEEKLDKEIEENSKTFHNTPEFEAFWQKWERFKIIGKISHAFSFHNILLKYESPLTHTIFEFLNFEKVKVKNGD